VMLDVSYSEVFWLLGLQVHLNTSHDCLASSEELSFVAILLSNAKCCF
jgi:hypothetical protein